MFARNWSHIISYADVIRGRWIAEFLDDKIDLGNASVLDIGCNVGAISLAFAEKSRDIYCGDISESALKTLMMRIQKGSIKNIFISRLNAISLPFKDNSFDLVVMNGVLEWVAEGVKGCPRSVQLRVLKEVKRVLRDSGFFYLGIEGRFSLRYFFGAKDHNGLRFVTFLPRRLANLYSRMVKGEEYRHYIYGIRGYKKILRESGFEKVEFYTAIPGYPYPQHIVKIEDKDEIKKVIMEAYKKDKPLKWGKRFLLSLNLYKTFGGDYVILAQ